MSLISPFSIAGTSWNLFWVVWKLISSANDIKREESCCTRLWAGRTAWLWLPSCSGRQSREGDRSCDMCQLPCGVPCWSPSLRAPPTPASLVAVPCRAVPCPSPPQLPVLPRWPSGSISRGHHSTSSAAACPHAGEPSDPSPHTPKNPSKPLPGPRAAFPRSLCERGSAESILVAAAAPPCPAQLFIPGDFLPPRRMLEGKVEATLAAGVPCR